MITPFITQVSYAGYIEDHYDVLYGYLRLPKGIYLRVVVPDGQAVTGMVKGNEPVTDMVTLSDSDPVYKELRTLSYTAAMNKIADLVKEQSQDFTGQLDSSRGTSKWRKLKQKAEESIRTKPYVELHEELLLRSIRETHHMSSQICSYEWDLLCNGEGPYEYVYNLINAGQYLDALRMTCLTYQIGKSDPAFFSEIARRFIGKFGYSFSEDLQALEKGGLIEFSSTSPFTSIKSKFTQKASGKPSWSEIRDFFNLRLDMDDNMKALNPDEDPHGLAEGYNGYVPLMIRLVEKVLTCDRPQMIKLLDMAKKMKIEFAEHGKKSVQRRTSDGKPIKRYLVFVVGGVTATEVMNFRRLGKALDPSGGVEFHIGSTSLTTGRKLLQDVCPHLQ